jgi:putative ABC transport system ATP-binding protein
VLSLRDISKTFDGSRPRRVLQSVDLDVAGGHYVAVTGESGVGKSTLLNVIAGLETPDTGGVFLDGVNIVGLADDALTRLRREQMGFVFQAFHVLPYLSVAQNVELPLSLLTTDATVSRQRVNDMLESVGLAERSDSMPRELSGGELQRVAIARALVHRPRLVLADEPTGNLDPETARQILLLLRRQIKDNTSAGILVTHSRDAASTVDEIFTLTPAGLLRSESSEP